MCGDKGVNCSWGQAVNVANRYVYVAQPRKDRVLVISKIQMVVVDVSITYDFMRLYLSGSICHKNVHLLCLAV